MSFKILLIEADPDWVDRVQRPLSEAGYEVIVAGGGDAGVAAVERDRPDLTLIRSILPDGDGLGYCQAIKSSSGGQDKPLILLSDAADQDPAEVACDARLAVPVAEKVLLDLCSQLLEGEVEAALNKPPSAERPKANLLESIEELGREQEMMILPGDRELEPPDAEEAERALEEAGGFADQAASDDITAHLESVFTRRARESIGSRSFSRTSPTETNADTPEMLGLEGEVIVAPPRAPVPPSDRTPPAASYGVDATRAAFQTQIVFGVDSPAGTPAESPAETAAGSAPRLALVAAAVVVVITAALIFVLPRLFASRARPEIPPSSAIPGGGSGGVKLPSTDSPSGWPPDTSPAAQELGPSETAEPVPSEAEPRAASPGSAQVPEPSTPAEEPRGFEPPRVLERAEPKYSVFDLEQAGFDTVMLRVLIDETGKPVRVVVEQGTPGSPLVASAIDAILHSKYEPATEDGSPVRAWKTEKFAFK